MLLDAPSISFADRLSWVARKLESEQLRTFMALVWAAWHCRNKVIFDGSGVVDAVSVAAGFVRLNEEYSLYNAKVSGTTMSHVCTSNASWLPPPSNCVKLNVDAHVLEGNGVSFGAVIRDEEGKLLVAAVKRIGANWQPEMAEAGAARYGVELARRLGYSSVILESDSLKVVRAIKTRQEGVSPIYILYDDIVGTCSEFFQFMCVHVRRTGNTLAHCIARWETGIDSERICMNSFPQSLTTLAELDLT
ncbi:uncharacterized protein [Spinacia oleracea]|uniref:RNase H type-1 domain-containing protein n=1 Tax=Spinacia oleracea TaxID=3562 RepID=A0A9R0JGI4_SPIOL|nr:uncharacterized protein LOC110805224 [Spinacia oleracea]